MIVQLLARLLETGEREAVLGDLRETGTGTLRSCLEVADLAVRRQLDLWKTWRPWAALLALALPGAVLFNNLAMTVGGTHHLYYWIFQNHSDLDPAILEHTGYTLRHGVASVLWVSALLAMRAWLAGYVLAALSRRALWMNALVFGAVFTAMSYTFGRWPGTSALVLFGMAFALGIRKGIGNAALGPRHAALAALTLVLEGLFAWLRLVQPVGPWAVRYGFISALSLWPAGFVLVEVWLNRTAGLKSRARS